MATKAQDESFEHPDYPSDPINKWLLETSSKPQQGWRIELAEHAVDVAFFDADMGEDQVKRSLVDHDGFPPDIDVFRDDSIKLGLRHATRTVTEFNERLERAFVGIREWTAAMEHLAAALNLAAESLRDTRLADALDESASAVRDLAAHPPVSEADLLVLSGEQDAQAAQLIRELRQEQEGGSC